MKEFVWQDWRGARWTVFARSEAEARCSLEQILQLHINAYYIGKDVPRENMSWWLNGKGPTVTDITPGMVIYEEHDDYYGPEE